MGKAVLLILGVVLIVYALFDLIATPKEQVRILPKILWAIVVFIPFAGALMWIFAGRGEPAPPPRPPRDSGGWTPPPRPKGPDDDPDYLRNL